MARKTATKTPAPAPNHDAVSAALKVLSDQHVNVYQTLYFQPRPLTSPGENGSPISVKRVINSGHITTRIELIVAAQPELKATLPFNFTENDVLSLANALISAKGKPVEQYACCALAERKFCVCIRSFTCPIHGQTCVGGHD